MKKTLLTLFAVAMVTLAIVIVGPVLYRLVTSEGVKTGDFTTADMPAASVGINGQWEVIPGSGPNATAVGYTFNELLPSDARTTSGNTREVTGQVEVKDGKLADGTITVDMTSMSSDIERRDVNVRMTIFDTDRYPTATFEVAEPVDISDVPDDATSQTVEVPGRLTIRGVTQDVTVPLEVTRTGENVLLSGDITINRLDYGVRVPDFAAALVDEDGELNIRLVLERVRS
ncbi:YceI family protein [Corynebacterium sp. TAE3-ERU12]|uniref:YceI family protein n=1 Tax=Corynebacterium sp. TAE3-ERU12 TaxID=2849491 RepID=UPI001C44B906|nr:YceI family protein [Corynebacterium sp. TAE3-ERU12]MBV7295490.1 YceI family protein [Corynebacterium sp. TAE3-ERU12]